MPDPLDAVAAPHVPPPSHDDPMPARDRTVIGVLLVATFVVILNETVMNVALPVLLEDLRVSAATGQWLTGGYLLTMSVVIPVTGFLIRRVATPRLFTIAMGMFSLGTLTAALAPGFAVLLVARVVQACGTAVMLPLLMTTVITLVPEHRRGAVMGNTSVVISVAPALGPTLSGLVLGHLGWRSVFWLVLPVAAAALLVGSRLMRQVGERTDDPVDPLSVVLSAVGFGGVVYGLSALGEGGAVPVGVVAGVLLVGAAALAAFVARQRVLQRADRALLDLRTLRVAPFAVATVMMMLVMASLLGTVLLLPLYLQDVLGRTPLVSGLLVLPGGALMGACGPVVGRLYDRVGARTLLLPGVLLSCAASWTAALAFGEGTSAAVVLGFHLAFSVGLALVFTPMFTGGLGSVPPRYSSHGSAIFATTQQLAGAAGIAVLVSVLSARQSGLLAAGASAADAELGGLRAAFLAAAVITTVAVPVALLFRPGKVAGGPVAGH